MGRTSAVTERTKANLIQAFWSCYEKTPLGELTVKAVTQAAGYNRSTFYLYFDDMDDLLEQAEDELMGRLKRIAEETISTGMSEANLEKGLGRWADECGRELRTVVGPWGDLRFLGRLKKLLCTLGESRWNIEEAALLSEFTSAVFVSASAYISAHPDADRAKVIHTLYAFIHGGAMGVLAT